jgi:hypothetical protein
MTDSTSEEHKSKYEINKMFDLAEKVIMEYFCYYLDLPPNQIFKDHDIVNMATEELILHPLEEYNKDKYLCFKLEMVPHDYQSVIPTELKNNQYVLDSIDFLKHAVNEVFSAILHHNLTKEASQAALSASFHVELDKDSNTFAPVYVYAARRQSEILNYCKDNLEKFYAEHQSNNTWETLEDVVKSQWNAQYGQVVSILENIHYDKNTADEKEKEINEQLKTSNRIGIVFRETENV